MNRFNLLSDRLVAAFLSAETFAADLPQADDQTDRPPYLVRWSSGLTHWATDMVYLVLAAWGCDVSRPVHNIRRAIATATSGVPSRTHEGPDIPVLAELAEAGRALYALDEVQFESPAECAGLVQVVVESALLSLEDEAERHAADISSEVDVIRAAARELGDKLDFANPECTCEVWCIPDHDSTGCSYREEACGNAVLQCRCRHRSAIAPLRRGVRYPVAAHTDLVGSAHYA